MLALLRHARQQPVGGLVRRRPALPSALRAAAALPSPAGSSRRPFAQASHMSVADLLAVSKEFRSKQTNFILQDQTLRDAVQFLAKNENSATLVVVDDAHKVVGLLTNHLVLERIAQMASVSADAPLTAAAAAAADVVNSDGQDRVPCDWDTKVLDVAIPAREILHVSPTDSLEDCRAVMALSGRGELPVLEGGKLLGTVSLIDIASLLHRKDEQESAGKTSAKSDYINVILPRKGLPVNTSLDTVPDLQTPGEQWIYYLHCFAMSIPHPGKRDTGGEDAYFISTIDADVHDDAFNRSTRRFKESMGPADVLAMGVADGVGSWFEQGISAKLYAQELMRSAYKASKISFAKEKRVDPSEVLHAAWATVLQREIVGSSTACILSIDPRAGDLHAVNLGDSGFLIIRDKKSDKETARQRGTLDGSLSRKIRDRESDLTPAGRRKGAHVSYRSPQQLHYFNCPFQLGFVGPEVRENVTKDLEMAPSPSPTPMSEKPLFETPEKGVRLRVPVLEGDLILLATDGLFDNVDEDVLLDIVSAQPEVEAMTRQLVQKAYDLSLDRSQDSPFARLAKENDLMWGGGMPDDITIIAARVQKRKVVDATIAHEMPPHAAAVEARV
ncbi:hypothetical protein P43SY_005953 [Pythium insidiosum]|uniref:Protein phosphatase n=1 Tax=Pythium insidiosum TaxID=114742 RepID=A0AAD5M7Z3_PYTIN|nr:hypothetical protein P43SY_005953 [Pythium insidiosum]KAJ0401411.1 hypothetical protein ATCC90586_009987 [Pythium insidiosum]